MTACVKMLTTTFRCCSYVCVCVIVWQRNNKNKTKKQNVRTRSLRRLLKLIRSNRKVLKICTIYVHFTSQWLWSVSRSRATPSRPINLPQKPLAHNSFIADSSNAILSLSPRHTHIFVMLLVHDTHYTWLDCVNVQRKRERERKTVIYDGSVCCQNSSSCLQSKTHVLFMFLYSNQSGRQTNLLIDVNRDCLFSATFYSKASFIRPFLSFAHSHRGVNVHK